MINSQDGTSGCKADEAAQIAMIPRCFDFIWNHP
jgi:hypothetical protein